MLNMRIAGAVLVVALFAATPVAAQSDSGGYIYGVVKMESGKEYRGFLRLGTQEAFWDDLFHSGKDDMPFFDEVDEEELRDVHRKKRRRFSLFRNWHFSIGDDGTSRMFITRFGDIDTIDVRGEGKATVHMKSGATYEVSGGADDVSSKIHVSDDVADEVELNWDAIKTIAFQQAPRGAKPGGDRLYGKLETREGNFEGYIQWDKQECLSIDMLDGDTEDGDVSVEMGTIRSIVRKGKRACEVTLDDGRTLTMRGTNDVNSDNRGIMVEDPRYGRVTADWSAFVELTFGKAPGSGRDYDDYPALGELRGVVTDKNGDAYSGRIVIDLDESEGWEMLNGMVGDVHFDVPLFMVESLEPMGTRKTRVVFRNGGTLDLEGQTDVNDDNAGVLVYTGDAKPVYIRWTGIERIKFE